jgi:hypothetical protein
MGLINKKEVTILPQSYFTSAEKEIARNNIGALGIDEYNSDVELFNNVYDTVSSNSAQWNEGGGSPEVSCEDFVEWNFNRQSTDDMLANPLLALCDTSGTPSGTLNAGDKYMIYVDGRLGQSAQNNTYVNFGMQAGTTSGQYLLTEPLPSKKLCRSTSTGNDFACAYMFTVPTNGTYSVAVAPDDNNNEYKFFGNTTIRQIKIG